MTSSTDNELMLKYQNGDYGAFEELFHRHHKKVFTYIKKRVSNSEEAEEIFQKVFTKLHKSRATFKSEYTFTQWIFVITKTVLIDFWNKENKIKEEFTPLENIVTHESSDEFDLEEVLGDNLVTSLSRDQKSVLELKYIDDLSYAEIAERLNSSQGNVRKLVSRAIKKIKLSLSNKVVCL